MREGSCEDNENCSKKSCSHLARSTLPGRRGSLLHKVLYEEVSPRGPTPSLRSNRFCAVQKQRMRNQSQRSREKWPSFHLSRGQNRESRSSVFHTWAIFCAVFDSLSSFFAPKPHGGNASFRVVFDSPSLFIAHKPHGNACYAV